MLIEKHRVIIIILFIIFFSCKNHTAPSHPLMKALDFVYKYKIILGEAYLPKYNEHKNKLELIRYTYHEDGTKDQYRKTVDIENKLMTELHSKKNTLPHIEKTINEFNDNLCGKDINGYVRYSPLDNINTDALKEINKDTQTNVRLFKTINKMLPYMTLYSDIKASCDKCTSAFNKSNIKMDRLIKHHNSFIFEIAPKHIEWFYAQLNLSTQSELTKLP